MKKLFTIILCALSIGVYAQGLHEFPEDNVKQQERINKKAFDAEQKAANWNFKFEDGKVYWQKTFEHPIEDSTAVREYFEKNILFTKKNDGYTANIALSEYSTQSNMNIPFILHAPADMVFFVQYKEGKYRVTLTNSTWKGKSGTIGLFSIMQENTLTLQDLASKSGKFQASSCKSTNICLINLFDYKTKLGNKEMLKDDF